ncbi:MAG: type II toxin-antitoxin system Phd/YefM family antitoxin [Planctomycetota bacterium]
MGSVCRKPELVLRDGKPAAVILDIREYEKLLERVEDVYDRKRLKAQRKKCLQFKKLDDFLSERGTRA